MRRLFMLAALLVVPALFAAPAWAGGGGHGGACAGSDDAPGGLARVVLRDNCFDPVGLVVEPGTVIEVRNDGRIPHTFTAVDGSFDTGILQPGASATVTAPDRAGGLRVYCTLHADRTGGGMSGLLAMADPADAIADASGVAAAAPGSGAGGLALAVLGGLTVGAAGAARFARRRPAAVDPA